MTADNKLRHIFRVAPWLKTDGKAVHLPISGMGKNHQFTWVELAAILDELDQLRIGIKEGCEAARNFGGEVVGDDDEPKWCVAAAVIADRKKRQAV